MFSFVVEALTFAVRCFLVVSAVGTVKFLSTKPPRGVVSLDLSPMDRYREVYARVFDFVVHKGGSVNYTKAITGSGFIASRYRQIKAVRASVVVTSTVAAMSAVTAIQNIYNTALDDMAHLPRGRLLPLTKRDVRPLSSDVDSPMRAPGAGVPERYSDYFVAARSFFEASVNAARVLMLFESLCIVNAVVSAKRFMDHRRTGTQRAIEGVVEQRVVYSDSTPDAHEDMGATDNDKLTAWTCKFPKMAVELAIAANKHYNSLWNKTKKGLDESVSKVFSSGDSDKGSKLGMTTVNDDSAQQSVPPSFRRRNSALKKLDLDESVSKVFSSGYSDREPKLGMTKVNDNSAQEGNIQSVPPSFRRRSSALRKLGAQKSYMSEIRATLDAREKAAEKGKAFVAAVQSDENTSGQFKKVAAVQGLRRRNTSFRDDGIKDFDRSEHVKVAKIWGSVMVGAILEEGVHAQPGAENITHDPHSRRMVTTGDLHAKAITETALSSEDVGKAARFSLDDADIWCTEVVVNSFSPAQLAQMEEGVLSSSSDGSLAQDAVRSDNEPTTAMEQPDSAGNSCTINGKQAAIVRPFSVSSSAPSNEPATQQMSFSNIRSRVKERALVYASWAKEQAFAYASGMFVSCYTAAVMHMSLYFSVREKYRNPTARSRYSDLLCDDELDVINGMPAGDLVSPVVHACRVSLSTADRDSAVHQSSR